MKRPTIVSCGCLLGALWLSAASCSVWAAEAPLADAMETQDHKRVRELLAADATDVNQAQADGMTALHWAIHYNETELARRLLAAGANPLAANRYGVTPLPLACVNGNGELARLLLAAGADANATWNGGETVLMTAARTGKVPVLRALLEHGAHVNVRVDGQTALMWAAAEGHAAAVQALLAAGAEFRTPLPSGFTPLFFAVREGQREVVQVLLAAGADVNEAMQPQRSSGKSPARGTSPLILAVENGHFELAVDLLAAGADPNDQRSGFGPLHVLTWVRKPNRGDGDDGDPPPSGSGRKSSLQFVRELVAHGGDVNLRLARGASGRGVISKVGATPFLMACITADVPLMRTLVELGADPLLPNAEGATPLMAAAGLGTRAPGEEAGTEPEVLEAVKLAAEYGGDVNAVDGNGETAMHGAAYKNLPRVVRLLDELGADVEVWNRQNKYGWSPILIAEGYRVGNFKPSPETLAALHHVLRAHGVEPPPPTVRPAGKGY